MAGLELTVTRITVSGTAFDRRTGDAVRLPEEGAAFKASVQVTQPIVYQVEGSIGPGEPVGVRVALDFALPPELFDDIDFAAEPALQETDWQGFVSAALLDHGGLEATVTRFGE